MRLEGNTDPVYLLYTPMNHFRPCWCWQGTYWKKKKKKSVPLFVSVRICVRTCRWISRWRRVCGARHRSARWASQYRSAAASRSRHRLNGTVERFRHCKNTSTWSSAACSPMMTRRRRGYCDNTRDRSDLWVSCARRMRKRCLERKMLSSSSIVLLIRFLLTEVADSSAEEDVDWVPDAGVVE